MMNKTIKGIVTLLAVTTIGMTQTVDAMEQTVIDDEQALVITDELAQKDEVVKPAKVKTVKKAIKKIKKEGKWFGGFKKAKVKKDILVVELNLTMGNTAKKNFDDNLEVIAEYAPKGWTINVTGKDTDGKFNAGQVQNLDGKQVIAHNHIDDTITLFEK